MTTQSDIQKRAEVLSQTRDTLAGLLRALHAGMDALKQDAMPDIRRAARTVAEQHNKLKALIAANPALFNKPRTQVVAGLKYGLQQQPGRMNWGDDAQLCERIHKLATAGELTEEQADLLITHTEKPVAKALEKLDAKLLKRLGVTVTADTDEVLIKSVDSEIEKAVNAVIKDVTKDDNAEVAV
jgi:hypothetical protein